MNNLNKKYHYLDLLGLFSIGVISLGYVIFVRDFAEQHIQLPFLNFPIFIGEILLLVCSLLFWAKYGNNPQKFTKWHYLILFYFIFVIIKALYGYFKWGPLALRHAALLYYPAFAVFGYAFFRRDLFGAGKCLMLFLPISMVFLVKHSEYWVLTLVFLGFILIRAYPNKTVKFLMSLAFLIVIPYKEFFQTSRMMIVGNFLSGLYLAGVLPIILGVNKKLKWVLAILIGGIVVLGLYQFADRGAVKSIVAFEKMAEVVRTCDEYIEANGDYFEMEERKEVNLYNPGKSKKGDIKTNINNDKQTTQAKAELKKIIVKDVKEKIEGFSLGPIDNKIETEVRQEAESILDMQLSEMSPVGGAQEEAAKIAVPDKDQASGTEEVNAIIRETFFEQVKQEIRMVPVENIGEKQQNAALVDDVKKEMQIAFTEQAKKNDPAVPVQSKTGWFENNNAVFRLLIWRDMWRDLLREKPVLGFSFGRPLRSSSLEMLHWGDGDWARDGWIEPHNSYWHIIYRTGIVGILLIFGFLIVLFKMIRRFIQIKSLAGILLCGIIINWFIAANFLVIFELPYTAIPIWTIYGMTFAYCYKTRERD